MKKEKFFSKEGIKADDDYKDFIIRDFKQKVLEEIENYKGYFVADAENCSGVTIEKHLNELLAKLKKKSGGKNDSSFLVIEYHIHMVRY